MAALAGIELDVVDHGAHRDLLNGQGVAGQNVGAGAGHDDVEKFIVKHRNSK